MSDNNNREKTTVNVGITVAPCKSDVNSSFFLLIHARTHFCSSTLQID